MPAKNILTNNPLTINDYRKILADIDGIESKLTELKVNFDRADFIKASMREVVKALGFAMASSSEKCRIGIIRPDATP
ncbi:MAG: hypothetical protein P8Z49_05060, partial [Acidobacteriota bacterium]